MAWHWQLQQYYYFAMRPYWNPDWYPGVDPALLKDPPQKGKRYSREMLLWRHYVCDPQTGKKKWVEMPQEIFDQYADVHRHRQDGIYTPREMRHRTRGPPEFAGRAYDRWSALDEKLSDKTTN